MCGIFGIAGYRAPVSVDVLERATRSLTHRGPDDGGTVVLRGESNQVEVGLGNRRLAILDLSELGHQPMHDPENGNWIVYNGEIYNFAEVRASLERAGVTFRTHCDTEVILRGYAHWGEKCLEQFRGMFAFAIWNAREKKLFLARDPMGIKPLYYHASERYLIFSSEIRTLLATGLVPRRIDEIGLNSYLTFGSVYEPYTLVEGVRSLPAGCCLNWKDGRLTQRQYWDLAESASEEKIVRKDADAATRQNFETDVAQEIETAVRMQMVSDVPVGIFLSGGIDSSALVALLSRNGICPATFSIVFREAEYSEAQYSRAVAKRCGTDHHEITVSQSDFFDAAESALGAMDSPTIDGLNTYFVAQQTRAAGLKVALSGLGGDEVFAGYSSFGTVPRLERYARAWHKLPGMFRAPLAGALGAFGGSNDQNRKLHAIARNGDGLHPYFLSRMLFMPDQAQRLRAQSVDSGPFRPADAYREDLERAGTFDPINRVSYLESRFYMLNTLLRDSDFMSMAHGLEVRVPLVDHQLAAKVLSLPGAWKIDEKTPKPLLVRALAGQLPKEIIHRPKRGFTLPFEHWLRGAMRQEMERTFSSTTGLAGWMDPGAAAAIWQQFLRGETSWSRPWALYVLDRWCRQNAMSAEREVQAA